MELNVCARTLYEAVEAFHFRLYQVLPDRQMRDLVHTALAWALAERFSQRWCSVWSVRLVNRHLILYGEGRGWSWQISGLRA